MRKGNWKTVFLDQIADLLDSKRVPLNSREREERRGHIPYYGASGIVDHIDSYLFEGEHVLISEDGENLRSRTTPIAFKADGKFWVNNHAHILRERNQNINDYIVYYFQNLDVSPYITGAVQPKLSKANLLEIPITIPDSPDYLKNLVGILRSLDDKIELNRQMNQCLEEMAQCLFRELCLPNGQANLQPGDELPEGWEWKTIGEMYDTTSGGTPKRSNPEFYENGSIPWVKSKELIHDFVTLTEESITTEALRQSSAKMLPKKSLLVAMYGATVGQMSMLGIEATCNQAICAIKPNDIYDTIFIYLYLKDNIEELVGRAVGSAQQNISQLLIKQFNVIKPPQERMNQFQFVTTGLYERILENQIENTRLTSLRNTILPQLMSGQIEVTA
ncbi:MAG: restriction endonuclease subunit S [Flavobacteriales bacterium]